jgi:ribose transport system ATP-binding protein
MADDALSAEALSDHLSGLDPIDSSVVLGVRGLSKQYGGIKALDNVSMSLHKGEALALIGSNGAGKSTLVKVLTGAVIPDEGHVIVAGEIRHLKSVAEARQSGIGFVPQELGVADDLTVAENVLAAGWMSSGGFVRTRQSIKAVRQVLDLVGLSVSTKKLVSRLSPGEQRLLMIARTLIAKPDILILDEPTAALADLEADRVASILRKLVRDGISVIYISHRMAEIERLCDRVLVLRDGRVVMEGPATAEVVARAVEVGLFRSSHAGHAEHGVDIAEPATDQGSTPSAAAQTATTDIALQCRGLRNRRLKGITFDVRVGEIVGLAGILGSGRTEILRAIAGADPLSDGQIEVFGTPMKFHSPHQAVAAGVGFIPEDRRNQGGLLSLTLRENLVLPAIPSRKGGGTNRSAEKRVAVQAIEEFGIKCSSSNALLSSLSGGNQQKVILARWVLAGSRILLLDEPTAGVDVVAKEEIMSLVTAMVRQGRAAVMVSSELEELTDHCDRIYVIRDGEIVEVLNRGEVSASELAAMCAHRSTVELSATS